MNVLSLTDFGGKAGLALTLPSTIKRSRKRHLRIGGLFLVSREGFVLPQKFGNHGEYLQLQKGGEVITEWLAERQIAAAPSEPGRVADQVLAAIGGFWGAHLLADEGTVKLLDKMSKSVRSDREGEVVEEYSDRTSHVNEWIDLLRRRSSEGTRPNLNIEAFVKAGALRLGLEVVCPNCEKKNWYGIGQLNERVVCERCLQEFAFPQGSLDFRNSPWRYRVAGPFSVPDYANGAYSSVLTLRCLAEGLGANRSAITFSTSLDLKLGGEDSEVDFACWYSRERFGGKGEEPTLVVGETKSFAGEAVKEVDVERLKKLATELPGTVLVFAVMKDQLSPLEKRRIGRLALWGRYPQAAGGPRAPVVVLTGTELFADHYVSFAWEQCGGRRQELVEPAYVRIDDLVTLADLTQQVYLDLPDYCSWYRENVEKHVDRRRDAS